MTNSQSVMMTHTHEHAHCCKKRFSWTAVFVGALVGVGLGVLLNIFNIAIGVSVFAVSSEGVMTLAIGGLVGMLIGIIISMFLAGMVAGYLGRPYCIKHNLGIVYGFTTWCVALILTVFLTSHIGHYISAYSNTLTNPATIIVTSDVPPAASNTAATDGTTTPVVISVEKVTNGLGMGAFIVFILFFISAVASCIGGHYGMACKDDEYCH